VNIDIKLQSKDESNSRARLQLHVHLDLVHGIPGGVNFLHFSHNIVDGQFLIFHAASHLLSNPDEFSQLNLRPFSNKLIIVIQLFFFAKKIELVE
jgi:hypothetical protein